MPSDPSELAKLMMYLEGYFVGGISDKQKGLMDGAQAEVATLQAQIVELEAELKEQKNEANRLYGVGQEIEELRVEEVAALEAELDTERSMRHEAQSDYGNIMEKTEALIAQVARLWEALYKALVTKYDDPMEIATWISHDLRQAGVNEIVLAEAKDA